MRNSKRWWKTAIPAVIVCSFLAPVFAQSAGNTPAPSGQAPPAVTPAPAQDPKAVTPETLTPDAAAAVPDPNFVPAEPAPVLSASGKVTKVDASAGTLLVETPTGEILFTLGSADVRLNGVTVPLSELQPGDQVTLSYTQEEFVNRASGAVQLTRTVGSPSAEIGSPSPASIATVAVIALLLLITGAFAIRSTRRTQTHVHI